MGLCVRPGGLRQGPEIETTLSHVEISSVPMRAKQNKLVVICRRIDLSPPSAVVGAGSGITTSCEAGGGGQNDAERWEGCPVCGA